MPEPITAEDLAYYQSQDSGAVMHRARDDGTIVERLAAEVERLRMEDKRKDDYQIRRLAELTNENGQLRKELVHKEDVLADCRHIKERVSGWMEAARDEAKSLRARLAVADKLIEGWGREHDTAACDWPPLGGKCTCGLWEAEKAYDELKESSSIER